MTTRHHDEPLRFFMEAVDGLSMCTCLFVMTPWLSKLSFRGSRLGKMPWAPWIHAWHLSVAPMAKRAMTPLKGILSGPHGDSSWWITMIHHDCSSWHHYEPSWLITMNHHDASSWCIAMMHHYDSSWRTIVCFCLWKLSLWNRLCVCSMNVDTSLEWGTYTYVCISLYI